MGGQKALITALREFIKKIEKKIKVEQVILFGSHARGNARRTSDIDIIIVSPDFANIKSFKRAPQLYLIWDQPYDIDIICLTPQELQKKQHEIGVIRDALSDGVLLSAAGVRRIKAVVE